MDMPVAVTSPRPADPLGGDRGERRTRASAYRVAATVRALVRLGGEKDFEKMIHRILRKCC